MKADRLIEIIDATGYVPSAYSGRGMNGRQCISFTTDDRFLLALSGLIHDCNDLDEAAEIVRTVKQDNMGLGIVVYWPHAEWPEDRT